MNLQCSVQPSQGAGGQEQIIRWLSRSKERVCKESVVWIYRLMLFVSSYNPLGI